jgi:hypothetical protein
MLFSGAKIRAKEQVVPCTITVEEILALIGDSVCPVRGVRYDLSLRRMGDDSPALDKFYSNLGYVNGNCFVVSNLANQIKSSATTEQVGRVFNWMELQEQIWDEGFLYVEGADGLTTNCDALFRVGA